MTGHAQGLVKVSVRPLWRIRIARELPRYVVCAAAAAGLVASARYAIAPPRPPLAAARAGAEARRDPAAAGYAVLFARRYLTWNASEPQASAQTLAAFSGPAMEAGAGLQLPQSGAQKVLWAEAVQERLAAPGERIYTVAAETDAGAVLYLTVPVQRAADGSLALAGYPAFVGAPAAAQGPLSGPRREASDATLAAVVTRALRNYLSDSGSELAADLASSARVSLPSQPLEMGSLQHLYWTTDGRSVLAVVQAQDARGTRYTLAYELDVARLQGRWEVSAVQMDPYA